MLWQSSRLLADAQERDEARADTATVQIAALREALRQIASRCNFVGTIGGDRGAQWAADLARAALAATEPEPTPRTDPYMAVFGVPSTTTEPAKPPSPQEPRYSAVTTAHKIATEKMTTLRGALSPRPAKEGERVRHVKRGSTYRVIGEAEVQCAVMVEEGDRLTVYRCDTDGKLWARPTAEFRDGRFEPAKESE